MMRKDGRATPRRYATRTLLSVLGTIVLVGTFLASGVENAAAQALDLSPLEQRRQQAASDLALTISTSEWLGPLAPVALSPFFGITCLSGLALFGPDWLPGAQGIASADSPLRSPVLFGIFLVLTLVTSLPRFSKLSKPFAQSIDRLEAYAGIITLLVIRYLGQTSAGDAEPQLAVLYQAGAVEVTFETLLTLVTIANVLVINAVKFFFEAMIWITPVPLIDAAFEIGNKLTCAALMGVYAYSPIAATTLNFLLLGVCALIFVWIRRREVFFRTVILEFFQSLLDPTPPNFGSGGSLTVFPSEAIGEIPKLARCRLSYDGQQRRWTLDYRRWLRPSVIKHFDACDAEAVILTGLFRNQITLGERHELVFGRKYQRHLGDVSATLNARYVTPGETALI